MASLARSGGLMPIIQPFTALYVLALSILGPVMTRESERVYRAMASIGRMLPRGAPAGQPGDGPPQSGSMPGKEPNGD